MGSPAELVGREVELQRLDAALASLDAGGTSCVIVEGEPGIGKTRLLAELKGRAEGLHHVVLEGRAADFERDVPFGIVIDALDAYLGSHDVDDWDPAARDELAAIFPSLRAPGAAQPTGLGDERYRAHRAIRWLIERLAMSRRLVISLDDLQWADDASVELIGSLLRRRPDAPVLLALAFRPGRAAGRLTSALAVPDLDRIELGQLSEADAALLLGSLDPRSRAEAYRTAGGNPFYLEQLARRGAVGTAGTPDADGGVPAAVAASLHEEIEGLAPRALALLRAASVVGEPFEPDLAAEVAEVDEATGLEALDELHALDLVRSTDLPRRFRFRHGLVHRAVYEATPGGWRLAAHARASNGLARRGAPAAERAHHVAFAAQRGDQEAIDLLLTAASESASRAPAAAVRWLEAALRLLPADDRQRQVDVRVDLASALRAQGELERARTTLLEAIDLLPPEANARRVELITSCAAVENWLGHSESAHRRLLDAWEGLPERDTAEAAALAIELTVDGLYALDFEQVFPMGERALAIAEALDDAPLIAAAGAALSLGRLAHGDVDRAREYRDDAAARIDRLPDAEVPLEALFYLGWVESFTERVDAAAAHFERGIEISRATGDGRLLVPLTIGSAVPKENRGRLAEAVELCEAAVETAQLTDNPQYLFWTLWELGWRQFLMGDLDACVASCEESARAARRLAGSYIRSGSGEPGWTLGMALIKRGELDRGLGHMLDGVGGWELRNVTPLERPWAREHLVLVEIERGNLDAAEKLVQITEEEAERMGLHVPLAIAARSRAVVQLATGDAPGAVASAERSVAAASKIGTALEAAWSRSTLGEALVAAGERERAIEVFRAAEQELDACGSLRERDAARRALRKLGVRADPRRGRAEAGADGIAALSKRELEIVELVTDRRTNKEIAEELFLSSKTIESHMRNIFAKLGVSSRVAVARAVEQSRRT